MSLTSETTTPLRHPDRFYIGGQWVEPSSASTFDVIDSNSEEVFFRVAEAQAADMDRAIEVAREAFDRGPWPRLSHRDRAVHLRAIADRLEQRSGEYTDIWPRESGVVRSVAQMMAPANPMAFRFYADLADTYPFEEVVAPTPSPLPGGDYGLLIREPVGVVGAIIPWNGPLDLIVGKIAPALLAGCTVIVKVSPEAPAAGYLIAEIAEEVGLPAGVVNVLTADREISEL
ncbi:MAG TPA: aldehyde dehydrogenase family protein, partial [Pseudonocardia sp.]